MNLELKDALYYDDLIYRIKSLAGFEQAKDEKSAERIIQREMSIVEDKETGQFRFSNRLSIFQQELIEIIRGISQKAGIAFRSLSDISKYPELVNEALSEIENKKALNSDNSGEINNLSQEQRGPRLVKKIIQ